ncbi:MAG: hypothetical protein ACXVJ1_11790 [Candidatus Angelobacter sp.]
MRPSELLIQCGMGASVTLATFQRRRREIIEPSASALGGLKKKQAP